jgi:hypothetical protein
MDEQIKAASGFDSIITSVARVAGADITITTVKSDNPFALLPYETVAIGAEGNTVGEVIRNSCFSTAALTHTSLVRQFQPAQPKKRTDRIKPGGAEK